MPYIILKHTQIQGTPRTIIVNDSEGIPMEFESADAAVKLAELFQANTTSGNIYEVKQLK
jgi:predicted amino acid dehydrogenase